jgi:hypothetical protein
MQYRRAPANEILLSGSALPYHFVAKFSSRKKFVTSTRFSDGIRYTTKSSRIAHSQSLSRGPKMPHNRKLKPYEQEQADARKAREEAFETAIKANPEFYNELKNAVLDARDAYTEIDKKYQPLSQARADAMNLEGSLRDAGLSPEVTIVEGLAALLERAIQPISVDRRAAADAYEVVTHALHEHFPYKGTERRPDRL